MKDKEYWNYYIDKVTRLFGEMKELEDVEIKVDLINKIRLGLQEYSPFKNEPVDCVQWVRNENVGANDYNPNSVAPPEMKLLHLSISEDGYTQPIVTWKTGENEFEVIDGFHRSRVGKEHDDIKKRVSGYLPVVAANKTEGDKNARIASTIRHNRARGKHKVDAMSDIIIELKNRNWRNERIARELGMDEDEILRLCQVTGLSGLFSDDDFSRSWEVENSVQDEFEPIDEGEIGSEDIEVRTVNTSDSNRVFHTFEKWECHKAGFYASTKYGMSKDECEQSYADFLSDTKRFADTLAKVIVEWEKSCEHYLTNSAMNRIAWLGQAAVCYATGVPSGFSVGFYLMTNEQQEEANETALIYLNKWLDSRGMEQIALSGAMPTRQSTIY